MTLPVVIAPSQVDAKSPIDEALMEGIKDDLDYLDAAQQAAGAFDYQFKVNGKLGLLRNAAYGFAKRYRVDGGLISKATTFQACRAYLEKAGISGTLDVDVRAYSKPDAPITSIRSLFTDSITSIGRVGTSVNTQSVARTTAQIATQSISRWKSTLNIQSIMYHGGDENDSLVKYMRINLDAAADADWLGGQVTIASATSGANNGTFTVTGVIDDGYSKSIIISNPAGVVQNTAAGTCDLEAWKYTFLNPVSSEFSEGETESFLAASHTSGGNNGTFSIYKINQGGNNIITRTTGHVAQAGVAGNVNVLRFTYTAAAAVSTTNYVVGEYLYTAGHTAGANDGTFRITAVNTIANGVSVYNVNGTTQAGVAGTFDTTRWQYDFATDPSANVSIGDKIIFDATTSGNNDGEFTVKNVNQSAGTNIVVANEDGVTQGGAAGTAFSKKKKVTFDADQSANITTNSRITITNVTAIYEGEYSVLEVNRGGGANYNAIIEASSITEQYGPQGLVPFESKSIFDTRPSITVNSYQNNYHATRGQVSSNAVLNATRKTVAANTLVMADIYDVPLNSENLVIQLL